MKLHFFPFFAGMNQQEARIFFHAQCSDMLEPAEEVEIFDRLIESLTGFTKLQRRPDMLFEINEYKFNAMVKEIKSAKPIQYVLGHEWFGDLRLIVNEHVLIPRPETEELVKWISRESSILKMTDARILDIGTGSGCIALALKKSCPSTKVMGFDISESALQVARQNASIHQLAVDFTQADILDEELDPGTGFHLIVSNPPYITPGEKMAMDERVICYEPHTALFVTNSDPLQFYKAILDFSDKYLFSGGEIYLELNRDFANDTQALFDAGSYLTELRKDMYGNLRMLKAIKKPAV